MGAKTLGKADESRPSAGDTIQERVEWELRPSGRRTQKGTMRVKAIGQVDIPSKKGYNESQDLREGGQSIQKRVQWGSRGTLGVKTP